MSVVIRSQAAIAALSALLMGGCSTQAIGTLAVPVWDYLNNPDPVEEPFDLATFEPAADTLYAIPLEHEVRVGEPVRIVVITGDPAQGFAYMRGVSVAAPVSSGYAYVADSFNVGAPGGEKWAMDGLWSEFQDDVEILGYPDGLIQPDRDGSREFLSFNVTPMQHAVELDSPQGALFNYEVTFDMPGEYKLEFVEFYVVDRTIYNDRTISEEFLWGDVTNDHDGVPSTVTVTAD